MLIVKALALGMIGAIGVPYVTRNLGGPLRPWLDWHLLHPVPGHFGIPFSIPIFLGVTLFAILFLVWADR